MPELVCYNRTKVRELGLHAVNHAVLGQGIVHVFATTPLQLTVEHLVKVTQTV